VKLQHEVQAPIAQTNVDREVAGLTEEGMAMRKAVSAAKIQQAVRGIIKASGDLDRDCAAIIPGIPQRVRDGERGRNNGANWKIDIFGGDRDTVKACMGVLERAVRKAQGELDLS
jgi:hypothetical protein